MAVVVRTETWDVGRRLREMGLSAEVLLEAIRAMASAKSGCTSNDPVTAPKIVSWQMGTRRLRELLRPLGWDKDDTDTFATTINHELKIQVVVVNSTEGTGLPLGSPLNTTRKGPKSERAANANSQTVLDLAGFPAELARRIQLAQAAQYSTWCLCGYVEGDIVRAELSQAVSYCRGFVSGWHERILFLPDGLLSDFAPVVVTPGPVDDGLSPDFPIEIRRK